MKKESNTGNLGVKISQETPQRKQEKLSQLSKKELVKIIQTQIETLEDLKQEIEKLKISRDLNSQISSKL